MKPIISTAQLQDGVARLAQNIRDAYGGRPLTIIGILTGSMILLADLIRQLENPIAVGLVHARSYQGATTERGPLTLDFRFLPDIRGRNVLLIDDIFDTGHTLKEVVSHLQTADPTSLRTAVLLRKTARSEVDIEPDFVIFEIPDVFVVGYGLDYNGLYRNLPYIAGLEAADLENDPSQTG